MVNYKNKYLKYKMKYLKLTGGVKKITKCDEYRKKKKCIKKTNCKWTPFPLPGKCWYKDEAKADERYENILKKYNIYQESVSDGELNSDDDVVNSDDDVFWYN